MNTSGDTTLEKETLKWREESLLTAKMQSLEDCFDDAGLRGSLKMPTLYLDQSDSCQPSQALKETLIDYSNLIN